jgi:hypothetical protein
MLKHGTSSYLRSQSPTCPPSERLI